MSKDNIVGKIRKLLAIADKNSGATENEMMTAMSIAQRSCFDIISPQVQFKVFEAACASVPRTNEFKVMLVRFLRARVAMNCTLASRTLPLRANSSTPPLSACALRNLR